MSDTHRHIVLFDMDGTLTESSDVIHDQMVSALLDLSTVANLEIGIVTGSDFDYVKQQVADLLDKPELQSKLHLLPCNGTKYYRFDEKAEKYVLISEESMSGYLGSDNLNSVMRLLIERQSRFSYSLEDLTGHFISYRGSMINWCPIGRNASERQRYEFITLDTSYEPSLRQRELMNLNYRLEQMSMDEKLVVKLGGDTSFDIYPKGWDKTYCLRFFQDYDVWFVGDRCSENGNDFEIYEAVNENSQAYDTSGPRRTVDIINQIKIKILKSNYKRAPLPR